jgi:hypothetical protein
MINRNIPFGAQVGRLDDARAASQAGLLFDPTFRYSPSPRRHFERQRDLSDAARKPYRGRAQGGAARRVSAQKSPRAPGPSLSARTVE